MLYNLIQMIFIFIFYFLESLMFFVLMTFVTFNLSNNWPELPDIMCVCVCHRYHGWFQPFWWPAGCSEVHPYWYHPGHHNHLLYLYPLRLGLNKWPMTFTQCRTAHLEIYKIQCNWISNNNNKMIRLDVFHLW